MGTVHERNVEALERRYRARPSAGADEVVRVRPAVAGGQAPTVEVHADDDRWVRLLSARDPGAEATSWVVRTGMAARDGTVILIGGGLGYVIEALEQRRPSTRVVVLEPEPALARLLLARRDWCHRIDQGRLAVIAGPRYEGLTAVAQQMPDVIDAPVHVLPALGRAWPGRVRAAREAAERLRFEASANQEARRTLAGRYLLQTLANAARVVREGDAAALCGLFEGTPAVIVAAGPSLDRNIHDLHVVRDRALIVACDTALRPLLSLGVEPQLAVAIDPSVANACHLGALHEPRRTWLAAEASLHPPAFAHFEQRSFFFRVGNHAPWPWLQAAGIDRLHLDVWGSVVTAALDLVIRMGCDPVIFAGTDLAFTGGQPYCRGTTLEAQWASWVAGGETYDRAFALMRDRWPAVTEPDVHGTPAHTASHLVAFRDWMVGRADRARPTRIVNATGAGILHGAPVRQGTAAGTLAGHAPLDLDEVQARLAHAHRPSPGSRVLFEHIEALEARQWRWSDSSGSPEAETDRAAIAAALDSPEYEAWRLGRRNRSS